MRIKTRIFVPIIVVLCLLLVLLGNHTLFKIIFPLKYVDTVNHYAEEYDLPSSLIYGVIHTESHFNETAVSSAGAKGLMQIVDTTFDWVLKKLGEEEGDVFDAETNIRCGTKLLRILSDEFTCTETVLAAYNAGIGNVSKWLENEEYSSDGETLHTIPNKETENYVKRVLNAQKMYQNLYDIE